MQHSAAFLAIVNDAKSRVKEWNFREVKRRLDAGEEITLIDTREDNEWDRGRLPGAVHLGRGIIERDIEKAVPDKSRTLVLYCGGGYRSAEKPSRCAATPATADTGLTEPQPLFSVCRP